LGERKGENKERGKQWGGGTKWWKVKGLE
jgi:hypothetical protein